MNNYGKKVKSIRIGKGYSQKYVSEKICTQGNYSKFELGDNNDIKYSTLEEFLTRLEVSFEEFKYIGNDYNMHFRDKIIYDFYHQSYNKIENLLDLKSRCEKYLKKSKNDKFIKNIHITLEGLLVLAKFDNHKEAMRIVYPIWDELSKRGDLFMSDIFLLNSILFIFPIETAVEMKNFAFRHIEKYKGFQNTNRLKINFSINISSLYIEEKKYKEALKPLDEAIEMCKSEQQYINLAICYVRKGICMKNLIIESDIWINKGFDILNVLEQPQLIEILEEEIKSHS